MRARAVARIAGVWLLAGIALGVLSRIEEVTEGLFLCISTYTTWSAAAYWAGRPLRAIGLLTAANASYYAYVAVTQPGIPLVAVAGPVQKWFVLGVAAGLVFGRRHWTALAALSLVPVWELFVR